jgi:membrane protease YdiL (CAAX protease family)
MHWGAHFVTKRKWFDLSVFVLTVSSISFLFHVAALAKSEIVLTVPRNGLSIGSHAILILLGSLAPGIALLIWSRECRAALIRLKAGVGIYLLALLLGFALPFVSYIGARHAYPLWDSNIAVDLLRIFLLNLLLTPLWEEVIWRGYFYPKIGSMIGLPRAIFVSALGWTFWHIGFIFWLHRSGFTAAILSVVLVQVFLVGIIQCSIFTLGRNSLAPCVLLHTSFNASTAVYYGRYGRTSDIGSYIAEALGMLLVSTILLRRAMRKVTAAETSAQSATTSTSTPSRT